MRPAEQTVMETEDLERDLFSAVSALEDGHEQLLRTDHELQELEAQLYYAGVDVEQVAAMTQSGEWADDADVADQVIARALSDSREVAVALAASGTTREEVAQYLDAAGERLVAAREHLAAAEARATLSEDGELIASMRRNVAKGHHWVSTARNALRHVDVSVAASQAYLSMPAPTPQVARAMATGAGLHIGEARTSASHAIDAVGEVRDWTAGLAQSLDALGEDFETLGDRLGWDEEQAPPQTEPDPSLAAVDLVELDAAYKQAAAAGRDDGTARDRAVAAAMASTAQRRKAGPPDTPTPRQRTVAAQRWEQNREYVESQREDAPRRD
ncbi:hypothetical protein GCM10022199_27640 [Marihabitans asiaticum]|uniref:Uncharacterized protein n=1 Tax=Marihabitans asiaticum TaxID=415218 RepID=A0A560W616_9MICO|nr:hypothetical protein [Marihabitans asiaticum]TWD13061.1 hypothetical protein FB557_2828 [Marihabitans asiaticum]